MPPYPHPLPPALPAQVADADRALTGPLHEGVYRGLCLAGDDVHEAVMTFAEALTWARSHEGVQGFTFEHPQRRPEEPTRVWFKSTMRVHYDENWWSYSLGRCEALGGGGSPSSEGVAKGGRVHVCVGRATKGGQAVSPW